jgi:hypothetical protein
MIDRPNCQLDRHVLRDWQTRIVATARAGHNLHHNDGGHAFSESRCDIEPCPSLIELASTWPSMWEVPSEPPRRLPQ